MTEVLESVVYTGTRRSSTMVAKDDGHVAMVGSRAQRQAASGRN